MKNDKSLQMVHTGNKANVSHDGQRFESRHLKNMKKRNQIYQILSIIIEKAMAIVYQDSWTNLKNETERHAQRSSSLSCRPRQPRASEHNQYVYCQQHESEPNPRAEFGTHSVATVTIAHRKFK
jgi:hypothetical protein